MATDIPTLIANVSALISATQDLTATAAAAVASRTLYGTSAPSNSLGVNGNYYIDTLNQIEYGPKASGLWGTGRSRKGDAGGNVASVGPASGMLSNPSTTAVPAGTTSIRTSDVGNPTYKYNASASSLAATIPGAIIYDSTGRGFILDELVLTPEMFGAAGDGTTNDTTAMQRLSSFVNWRGHAIISFRGNGTYIVGRQATSTAGAPTPAYTPEQVLNFTSVDGLLILGNGAKLKNLDGLHYGTFNPSTGARYDPPAGGYAVSGWSAAVGHILQGTNCTRVTVQDLKIDGNSDNMTIGGYYGDKGYQIPGDCMRWTTSSLIKLQNLELVNAPHDGLYLNINGNYNLGTAELTGNFLAENVMIDRCGRQGCSITGGSGLMFRQCKFNRSGQGIVHSPPMAGCDIEPVDRWASDISFEQCQFVANGGVGLINDSGLTERVMVRRCVMWGGFDGTMGGLTVAGGHALLVDHDKFDFEDCEIHGTTPTLHDDTTFRNCLWDAATHPTYGPSGTNANSLINTGGGMFYDCLFEIPIGRTGISFIAAARAGRVAVRCTFNWGATGVGTEIPGTLGNRIFVDCNFVGLNPVNGGATRPGWGTGGGTYVPIYRGNNTVSGNVSVSNIYDGQIPETYTPQTRQMTYRASDASATNNILYNQEYRAAPPTTGYVRAGSVIFNTGNTQGAPSRWECTTEGAIGVNAWAPNTTYFYNDIVVNDSGKSYVCTKAGVSAASGGPTGLSAAITDNQVTWRYYAAFVYTPIEFDVPGLFEVPAGTNINTVTRASLNTQRWSTVFAATKTCNLSATTQVLGRRYRLVRAAAATGAFVLNIVDTASAVTIKSLNVGEWCEVEFNGTNFVLVGFGTGV